MLRAANKAQWFLLTLPVSLSKYPALEEVYMLMGKVLRVQQNRVGRTPVSGDRL